MAPPRDPDARALARAVRQELQALALWGVTEIPVAVGSPARAALKGLERQVQACTRCPLYRTATQHVFGDGSPDAGLMFIGEAPGRDEDLQGKPFVGAAGKLLNKMIEAMGLKREEVYIANIIKHRPPANRLPEPDEVEACLPHLLAQIEAIQPTVLCTLGSVATRALLGPGLSILKIRGSRQEFQSIPLIPTFHPAYLLRNPDAKKLVWQDLKKVKALLSEHE